MRRLHGYRPRCRIHGGSTRDLRLPSDRFETSRPQRYRECRALWRTRARIEQSDTAFRIILEDEGPGIPEARLESVFEPFIRLDESRNMESGGIGLGLSIVRSIVQSHGGDVILENREEGGLRVTIALPLD